MPDCHKCRYYYVTWDKYFPHGCKAIGFKSRELPSVAVKASSKWECLLFEAKTLPQGIQKAGENYSEKLW